MTLAELLADCYRRLNYATSPDATVSGRLTAFLNESQQEILSEPGMESLLDDVVTFASVASTAEYSLPQSVARVKSIRDTTNLLTLAPLSESAYKAAYPDPTLITGIADSWVDLGYAGVSKQPSNASELFVVSTAAADGATKKANIEGYTTGGAFRAAAVAMNGVTAVSFGATITTWERVTKFYLSLASDGSATSAGGVVSLCEDSGIGTVMATIPISQSFARYRRIALAICPSSAITYSVDFERDIIDMATLNDQPILPPRFHRLLAIGARMREYEKQDDGRRYLAAREEWSYGLRKVKFYVHSQAVGSPNLQGGPGQRRPSRLGAMFGVDRW